MAPTERLAAVFSEFDSGSKGVLARDELKCAITAVLGHRPTKYEIAHLLVTGFATFESFARFVDAREAASDARDEARALFDAMDGSKRGFLTREDVRTAFSVACPALSGSAVDDAFDEVDTSQRGHIGFQQFEWIVHGRIPPERRYSALCFVDPGSRGPPVTGVS
jgi:Ca2+-binding EF-hand superfamily protein